MMQTYRAKKHLGQNFLKSAPALAKMLAAGEVSSNDTVLEIGPGKGALTARLLEAAGQVIAVEKDPELYEFLQTKFEKEIAARTLILVHDDVLKFEGGEEKYKVIANIPYNITGAILKKFLTAENKPERMVLMVQKEVAERIVGREKESILSISVKAYGEPKLIMKVEKRYFSPAPKVDSAIIAITNISKKFFEQKDVNEEKFWEIVKKGFAHKRKRLGGNLKGVIEVPENLKNKRAEDLSLTDWLTLAKST
jgi:16S rRNA (adenine1518-N6/adenine1519-N6)-dimethyltransferase